jgi:hypothetical protein
MAALSVQDPVRRSLPPFSYQRGNRAAACVAAHRCSGLFSSHRLPWGLEGTEECYPREQFVVKKK